MKHLTFSNTATCVIFLLFFGTNILAQESSVTLTQNPDFENLLSEKIKINSSATTNDRYKIQIYTGTSDIAKSTVSDFKRSYADVDVTVVFFAPNYKVVAGNFERRIDAEHFFVEVKKKYPNALLIKPRG